MTEMNENNANEDMIEEARIKRRRILKAGAVIAPLAVTLHGGAAFAQVTSAGRCVQNLSSLEIPLYDQNGNQIDTAPFSPSFGAVTGRNFNGEMETHWDYVLREQIAGQTCLQSFIDAGGDRSSL